MEFHPIPWVHLREVTFRDQSSTSGRVMVDGCGWCMMVPYAIAVSRKKCCFPLVKMLVPRLFQPFNPLFMVNQRGHFPWDKICWFPGFPCDVFEMFESCAGPADDTFVRATLVLLAWKLYQLLYISYIPRFAAIPFFVVESIVNYTCHWPKDIGTEILEKQLTIGEALATKPRAMPRSKRLHARIHQDVGSLTLA